jgi:hypothetical protein
MSSPRTLASFVSLLCLALALAGCGKKAEQPAAGGSASDSLLAASPVEQPQGQIPPQANVTTPAPEPTGTTAPTPTRSSTGRPAEHSPRHSHESQGEPAEHRQAQSQSVTVPAGTSLTITMGTALNTETAKGGDPWSGTIKEAVTIGSAAPFPVGSTVAGVVEAANGAAKGDRAFIVLRVTSISANGRTHAVSATADSLVAGSTRKRNVGAVAGGAVAGALLGRALGGSGKGAVIGGILGGAAATGVVAGSKGFQVDVPQGKDLVFKVDGDTRVEL